MEKEPKKEKAKEPQRAPTRGRALRGLLVPALAIFTAFVVSGLVIIFSDLEVLAAYRNFFRNPQGALSASWRSLSAAYGALFRGSIGSPAEIARGVATLVQTGNSAPLLQALYPISESLTTSVPYIFTGLAVALGFRCGLFNIGVEGQLWIGALTTVFVGYSLKGLPWFIHLPLAILAGIVGGALWSAFPGFLKARTGAHEVINTIMMNYIAYRLADFLLTGPMKRSGYNPVSPPIEPSAALPRLFPEPLRFHAGFFLALLAAALVYWLLWKTTLGFEIRTVGANPDAARYAGISITRNFVLAMAFSGALAGLAGGVEVLGVNYYVAQGFSYGYGFDSIALALLGKSRPLGVVLAALLFGTLRAGAAKMQMLGIPIDIIKILQAMVIIFIAAPELVRMIYRIKAEREVTEVVFTRGWGG